jgi:hypothetical protein
VGRICLDMLRQRYTLTDSKGIDFGGGRTLRRLCGILIWECDFQFEEPAFPDRLFLAWDADVPFLEVHHAVCAAHGLGEEAEGMVASPLLPETR